MRSIIEYIKLVLIRCISQQELPKKEKYYTAVITPDKEKAYNIIKTYCPNYYSITHSHMIGKNGVDIYQWLRPNINICRGRRIDYLITDCDFDDDFLKNLIPCLIGSLRAIEFID